VVQDRPATKRRGYVRVVQASWECPVRAAGLNLDRLRLKFVVAMAVVVVEAMKFLVLRLACGEHTAALALQGVSSFCGALEKIATYSAYLLQPSILLRRYRIGRCQ
jgi:hypothetical protein